MSEQQLILTCLKCQGKNPRPLPYSMVRPDTCDHCLHPFRTMYDILISDFRYWRAQSKLASVVEAVVNTFIGLALAFVATKLICWAYSIPMSDKSNFIIVSWMTGISVLRSYVVRRIWNSEFWKRHLV